MCIQLETLEFINCRKLKDSGIIILLLSTIILLHFRMYRMEMAMEWI